jgi:hypothetical protein
MSLAMSRPLVGFLAVSGAGAAIYGRAWARLLAGPSPSEALARGQEWDAKRVLAARRRAEPEEWRQAGELFGGVFYIWIGSALLLPLLARAGHFPAASLAAALLLLRRRIEAALISGDHLFLRESLRQGERAFRAWIQSPPGSPEE